MPFWLRARLRRRIVGLGPPLTALMTALLVILWSIVAPVPGASTWHLHAVPFKLLALFVVGGALGVIAIPFLLPLTLTTNALLVWCLRAHAYHAGRPQASRLVRWIDRQPFWGGAVQGLLVATPLAGLFAVIACSMSALAWGGPMAMALMITVALITGWSRHEMPLAALNRQEP